MPDHRQHRGPHPKDHELFAAEHLSPLRDATRDLSWLLTREYAPPSALKLVGDRYALNARQRLAIGRCACPDAAETRRRLHHVQPEDMAGQTLWIDGYNVLTSIEAALSGGVILHARDGCYRDMASMHGSYRRVAETKPALELLGQQLADCRLADCHWLFDQPVSNSGRLKVMLQELADQRGWPWHVEVVPDPDRVLAGSDQIVATADSQILDAVKRWFNLARATIAGGVPDVWLVDLTG